MPSGTSPDSSFKPSPMRWSAKLQSWVAGAADMDSPEHPKESNLEHVVSLSDHDVEAIDSALLGELRSSWSEARRVVTGAHYALLSLYPAVPDVFFSYRLRKLVAAGTVEAVGQVDRQLNYQVRVVRLVTAP